MNKEIVYQEVLDKISSTDGGVGSNLACLLSEPQQKLQLNYTTAITQNHQKIKQHENLTTKELKKSHSSR